MTHKLPNIEHKHFTPSNCRLPFRRFIEKQDNFQGQELLPRCSLEISTCPG